MIDLQREQLITLREAARRLPRRRRGRPIAVSTIYRWSHGVRGVRLEVVRLGGSLLTSVEALQRFVDSLTAATTVDRSRGATRGQQQQQQQQQQHVEDQLNDILRT